MNFNARNKHTLDKKYICPLCELILRNPLQLTGCGHRICRSCINCDIGRSIINCPACQVESKKSEVRIDRAFANELRSLPIECFVCDWSGILNNYQDHLDQLHKHLQCKHCGTQCNSVDTFHEHKCRQSSTNLIDCPLKQYGCNQQIIGDKSCAHFLTQQHQEAIIKTVVHLNRQPSDVGRSTEFQQENNTSTNGNQISNDNNGHLLHQIRRLPVEQRESILDFLAVKLSVEESRNLRNDPTSTQTNAIIDGMDRAPRSCDDGTLVWEITNFREKLHDAQSERQTSIDSPPFYSSPTEYKMRARLYLNGDGTAHGTHMSLFFQLIRGSYDAILRFPFTDKVTFCLHDQTAAERHIIDSFRPDIKSNSFQRPRSDMNIASGIPKFVPLASIQQEGNPYVRDDTMFIKIMVEFIEVPKPLLPYVFTLNPGLPADVRQELIEQEMQRRTQKTTPANDSSQKR